VDWVIFDSRLNSKNPFDEFGVSGHGHKPFAVRLWNYERPPRKAGTLQQIPGKRPTFTPSA
jgi:hypothetical protein